MSATRVRIERASIRDFRNLEDVELVLPDAGVAIVGENGQGKTNLLEALYYLQILRSARGARDQDLARFGTAGFHVSARLAGSADREIAVGFDSVGKRKKFVRDGIAAAKLSDAFGSLPSVMFSPRDIELVSGSPSERRRFIDVVLALRSRRYLSALQQYRAALNRRNAALRSVARGRGDTDSVAAWEPALADNGAMIACERRKWVADAASEFARLCAAIGEEEPARMEYVSATAEIGDARETLARSLEQNRLNDIRRGLTTSGPHRDDVLITLSGRDIRSFGSAGQQRTAATALRMLEASSLREHSGREPVLLLDDPFAELDTRRAGRIQELLTSSGLGQTILAVPREADIPADLLSLERLRIRAGTIQVKPS
ncbi:MAG TPA: DNA replication and repair protein RecF [Gemmatimonadaceae bacterium]